MSIHSSLYTWFREAVSTEYEAAEDDVREGLAEKISVEDTLRAYCETYLEESTMLESGSLRDAILEQVDWRMLFMAVIDDCELWLCDCCETYKPQEADAGEENEWSSCVCKKCFPAYKKKMMEQEAAEEAEEAAAQAAEAAAWAAEMAAEEKKVMDLLSMPLGCGTEEEKMAALRNTANDTLEEAEELYEYLLAWVKKLKNRPDCAAQYSNLLKLVGSAWVNVMKKTIK